MSAALKPIELSAEALDLIREGTPKPKTDVRQVPEALVDGQDAGSVPVEQSVPEKAVSAGWVPPGIGFEPERKPKGKASPPKERETSEKAGALVSVTFRLPAEIPLALVRASAERKIRKERPFTQQEIVAEALAQWLRKAGFSGQ